MVGQIFLLMGEIWSMHNDRYTVRGDEAKGREEFLCLNFSCLTIKYEFYFALHQMLEALKFVAISSNVPSLF